jgi:hypothetical protein
MLPGGVMWEYAGARQTTAMNRRGDTLQDVEMRRQDVL